MIGRLKQLFASPEPVEEAAPRVFKLPSGMRAYAVGDIHGKDKLLAKMLRAIEEDAKQHPDKRIVQIFLGDYIDRGIGSKEVIDLLMSPPPANHKRVCLMGNHEEALLHFLEDPNILRDWANFGGYATLISYGIPIPDSMLPGKLAIVRDALKRNIPERHLEFFNTLKLTHELGDYLFVHAGVHPRNKLSEQKPEHLLWIRSPFLDHKGYFDQYIVHGHTPVAAPEIHKNRANLDVSGASINSLCCLVMDGIDRHTIVLTDKSD
jgi:serine/threonine protein phosphatase 1